MVGSAYRWSDLVVRNGSRCWYLFKQVNYMERLMEIWIMARVGFIAPVLNVVIPIFLTLSVLILVEKIFFGLTTLYVKVFKLKPKTRYRWEAIKPDLESGNIAFPMVLIQIPMYNEKEVYRKSIRATTALDWPSDRLIIQVLDDSTDCFIKKLIKSECEIWEKKGLNIRYQVRNGRQGYKAGALKEGMKQSYVQDCEYVAMFDADFEPESDFLIRSVPYLIHNPELALVQGRWKFSNADACLMTRIQEMSLDYHFKIEQEAGSTLFSFFGFNGIWRVKAIVEAGGWNDRTTVEDMDLAIRACLKGFKFIYDGDIKLHRWCCGPANLMKKIGIDVLMNKKISIWLKTYIIYSFFFIGKIVSQINTFILYCFLIPISVMIPEVPIIPMWGVVYVPMGIALLKGFGAPSSAHLIVLWVLFENVLSFHRFKAAFSGFIEIGGRVNEWVVTEKCGDKQNSNVTAINEDHEDIGHVIKRETPRTWHRFHIGELMVGVFIATAGVYDVLMNDDKFFFYLFLQSFAFFVIGFGLVGL
ncbi:Glucomannan 4-beta-mannosyltransferase, family GT2 [Zostera marina]|uniref:glucomannan 4-beta-mannosyltransferase n=1 Tax=Zostera marina TaxID=29655 RepID=A0A0K9P8R8_ZOSMR|nr:Glucomannan 4-beta-mannosyltransferase, family GT2 [Zostera marina]